LKKNELLELKDEYYVAYYCKDDICVKADYEYRKIFIEFPDKNGNIKLYNIYTSINDNAKLNKYSNVTCNIYDNIRYCVSYECTTDSECLSNKCINNYCVFNEETPLVHCDDIYIQPSLFKKRSSYIYCGKAANDICENNDECSFKQCYDGICLQQEKGPSDSESMILLGYYYILLKYIGIIVFVIIVIYFFVKSIKIIKNQIIL